MYRTLLVPVDGSSAATAGLDEAIRIAAHVGARLHLMNIVDDGAFDGSADSVAEAATSGSVRGVVRERGEKVLRRARERAEARGVIASTALVASGSERLLALVARQADESGADLIVLGMHRRRSLSRIFSNSESKHLLNEVDVPVLLVRTENEEPELSVVEITASDSMFQPVP
jgi:nucleotide-binding universal stress UspA family protein